MSVRILTTVLFVMCVSGCAAPVITVRLSPPDIQKSQFNVVVRDARLDQQVYMTGISFGSASNIYMLAPEPPVDGALRRFIEETDCPRTADETFKDRSDY